MEATETCMSCNINPRATATLCAGCRQRINDAKNARYEVAVAAREAEAVARAERVRKYRAVNAMYGA